MSNLSLPSLTFEALRKHVLGGRNKHTRTVANNTVAALNVDPAGVETITVWHHGSTIATLTEHTLYVTNAGYSSASTRERVNGFLSSAQTGTYVAQRNYSQVLFDRYGDHSTAGNHERLAENFRSVMFEHGILTLINNTPVRI